MQRVFRSKLLLPAADGYLFRPRLMDGLAPPPRHLVLQAPVGAGKSSFLAQWLPRLALPFVYLQMDERDRDGGSFAAHICSGFRQIWPDWAPADAVAADPVELAAELAGEAGARPPAVLALDGLENAFGEPWLADFLTILVRYAPLRLALSTRAPLPVELGPDCRYLRAADLAYTRDEAEALLGPGGWGEFWQATGGLPLALAIWQRAGGAWQAECTARVLKGLPEYIPPESGQGLVAEWLSGRLSLAEFGQRVSVGQPGAEQLWKEIGEIHLVYADHPPTARERADALWETARGRGDRPLMAATALLQGEITMAVGEYALALDWYQTAFAIDPLLELTGSHGKTMLLRDLGRLDEAEALARRCVEARAQRGDLVALALGHVHYGIICMERGRLDEADQQFVVAEEIYRKYAANIPVAATATCQRALLAATRGDMSAFRRLAEEAHSLVRGRFRFMEALTGMVLAAALVAWGDRSTAERLLGSSYACFSSIGAKFWLHNLLTIFARKAWAEGDQEGARRQFDQALALAAHEGYVQHLTAPRTQAVPLLLDALAREVEAPFCQELLVRMGARALPGLVELAASPDARVRRTALYPLAAIGGEDAAAAVRRLLHDPEPAVRDSALLAYQSMVRGSEATVPPAAEPAHRLSVALLGPMTVAVEGKPLARWRTAKARDLLAYFLLAGERPVTRDQVIESLWPEADYDSARALLNTTLYNLRSTLGAPGEGLITFAGGAYQLRRAAAEVDLDRFERRVAEGAWRAAADLYRGDLLEGLDYPWCEAPRVRARQMYQTALRRLAASLSPAEAVEPLLLLIQVDPLDEEAHLGLMEAYAGLGNRSAALQQYRTLARLLDEELGLEPGIRTQELYRRLLD